MYYKNQFDSVLTNTTEASDVLKQLLFSQRMVENLINDLLDMAKLENSSFNISNENIDLAAVIHEAF